MSKSNGDSLVIMVAAAGFILLLCLFALSVKDNRSYDDYPGAAAHDGWLLCENLWVFKWLKTNQDVEKCEMWFDPKVGLKKGDAVKITDPRISERCTGTIINKDYNPVKGIGTYNVKVKCGDLVYNEEIESTYVK